MRNFFYAILLGCAIAGLDTACLFIYDGNIKFLAPLEELMQLYWRHGLFVVFGSYLVKLVRPRWTPEEQIAGGASILLLGLSFVWVHSRIITGVRLWEPISILASIILFIAVWMQFKFWSRNLFSLFGKITLALALALFSTWTISKKVNNNPGSAPLASDDLPNITLIVFDTLRADRLSSYGYNRPTSPNIDAIASQGALFEHAFSVAPWTRPSIASIFTGLHPSSHGAYEPTRSLPEWSETIAEMLQEKGYQTGGFSANANISAVFGFAQGFEHFWCLDDKELLDISTWGEITSRLRRLALNMYDTADDARLVNAKVLPWLDSIDEERPTFTYVQYLDPHFPYNPPEDLLNKEKPNYTDLLSKTSNQKIRPEPYPFGQRLPPTNEVLQGFSKLYDAEIRFMDKEFRHLIEKLKEKNLLRENDWLILTSDHGEEFFEHSQWGHGQNLYEEVMRIPLIIKGPGAKKELRINTPVSLIDLLPTIAAATGTLETDYPGQPLQNLIVGKNDSVERRIYSEKLRDPQQYAIQLGFKKYIEIFNSQHSNFLPLLYNLEEDPQEKIPFVEEGNSSVSVLPSVTLTKMPKHLKDIFSRLRELLNLTREEALLKNKGSKETDLDPAMRARLAELGYL